MSRDLEHFASLRVVWRVASGALTSEQVNSRNPPNRTENPRVGGSIPSLATVWDNNSGDSERPALSAHPTSPMRLELDESRRETMH